MIAARASQFRLALVALLAAALVPALLGCGGGDELSPPVPVAMGPGMATVTLGGVDLGETGLVTALISEARDSVRNVVAEPVTFTGDPPVATLSVGDLAPDSLPGCAFVVTNVADPSITYTANVEYTVDFMNGLLTAVTDGMGGYLIADGTAVTVSFCALEPIFTVAVGVTLPEGDSIGLEFFNIPEGASGMRNTNVTANDAPLDGSFAWSVTTVTDVTILNSTEYRLVDDLARNDGTVISADLTNRLNPCLEGRVVAVMEDPDRVESILEVNFIDPECP